MIDSPLKLVCHAVDLYLDLIQVSLPMVGLHSVDPPFSDLGGESRAKPKPPVANRFTANADPKLVQKLLNISKRKRKPDLELLSQADEYGPGFEVSEQAAFCHREEHAAALSRTSPLPLTTLTVGLWGSRFS